MAKLKTIRKLHIQATPSIHYNQIILFVYFHKIESLFKLGLHIINYCTRISPGGLGTRVGGGGGMEPPDARGCG
jgi:hypothetical protein